LNIAGDTKQLKSNRAFQNVKVITLAMKLGVIFSNLLIGRVGFSWCEALGWLPSSTVTREKWKSVNL